MKRLLLLLLLVYRETFCLSEKAITIVPVADLIGNPCNLRQENKVLEYYNGLPICGMADKDPRIHQLLFNEIVEIQEERGAEARVIISNVYYKTRQGDICTNYWCPKKNFVKLKTLREKHIDLNFLPAPIQFNVPAKKNLQNIVTLKRPYISKILNCTLSAGTRFVKKKDNGQYVDVYILNAKNYTIGVESIPKDNCVAIPTTKIEQRALFVSLIKEYAHLQNGFIPYVWGGCSFTNICLKDHFLEKQKNSNSYFLRPELKKPYTGFDCSGLIWRTAQMCGLPIYFKNSFTLAQQLASIPLTHVGSIHNGDIIWFPGHVLVISDMKRNLTVEARAYSHGFGKVHELPLSAVFNNIVTFTDLIQKIKANKIIERINKQGKIVQTIDQMKILKLIND